MTISNAEFRAVGSAMFGPGWQTAIAHRLDVSIRTVQRWASGEVAVPEWVAIELGIHSGEPWPRDRWLLAFGGATDAPYIVHAQPPRFIARLVRFVDDQVDPDDLPADTLTGVTIDVGPSARLCEVVWLDPVPPEDKLVDLMRQASQEAISLME